MSSYHSPVGIVARNGQNSLNDSTRRNAPQSNGVNRPVSEVHLDSLTYNRYNAKQQGPVAQLGERYNRTVEVKGSNPFRSIPQTILPRYHPQQNNSTGKSEILLPMTYGR